MCVISQLYDYTDSQGGESSWLQFEERMSNQIWMNCNDGGIPKIADIRAGVDLFQSSMPFHNPFWHIADESVAPSKPLPVSILSRSLTMPIDLTNEFLNLKGSRNLLK